MTLCVLTDREDKGERSVTLNTQWVLIHSNDLSRCHVSSVSSCEKFKPVRMWKMLLDIEVTSHPIRRGAFIRHHSEKCVLYSTSVIPPFPISNMSGSFHPER